MASTSPPPQKQSDKTDLSFTAFREAEKRYKLYKPTNQGKRTQNPPETDFTDVVDFANFDKNTPENQKMMVTVKPKVEADFSEKYKRAFTNGQLDLKHDVRIFTGVPGLVLFPQVVPEGYQRHLVQQALTEYSRCPPYPNNVVAANPDLRTDEVGYQPELRWATLGWTYNWTTKQYVNSRAPLPTDVTDVIEALVAEMPRYLPETAKDCAGYTAQAGIVNYYPVGSMLCCHQDVAEPCMNRPLVSMSLGCSGILLMGTQNRNDKPYAFFLRSGDVAAFTGPSRANFHAVPRVLDDLPQHFFTVERNGSQHQRANMEGANHDEKGATIVIPAGLRVNINIRHVSDTENLASLPLSPSQGS